MLISFPVPASGVESIKRRRKALGLSLAELATRAGIGRENVARIESAAVDPRASNVALLAKAMGVPVCELFDKEYGHERRPRRR
jgi:transcriptional regulator with XRE-family HTH domain